MANSVDQGQTSLRRLIWVLIVCSNLSVYVYAYVLGAMVGYFVLSPREGKKKDGRDSREDEREGHGRERNRNESEETEEIKTFPLLPLPATNVQG